MLLTWETIDELSREDRHKYLLQEVGYGPLDSANEILRRLEQDPDEQEFLHTCRFVIQSRPEVKMVAERFMRALNTPKMRLLMKKIAEDLKSNPPFGRRV